MNRTVVLLLAAFVLSATPALAAAPFLDYPPLLYKIPPVSETMLPSGNTALHLVDREVPLISFRMLLKAGSVLDPYDKKGLTELLFRTIRTSATSGMTYDKINNFIEGNGITLEFGVSDDAVTAYISCGREHIFKTLDILFSMLSSSMLDEEAFLKRQKEEGERIRRQNENIKECAFREFNKITYGETHPRGAAPAPDSVRGMTREDILKAYPVKASLEGALIGLSGDLDTQPLLAYLNDKIAAARGDMAEKPAVKQDLPPLSKNPRRLFHFRKEAAQAGLIMGHAGVNLHSSDSYSITVFNALFGTSSMSSLLSKKIRIELGLSYKASGAIGAGLDTGIFYMYCECDTDKLPEAAAAAVSVLLGMRDFDDSAALALAKDSIINDYIFNFDSSAAVVSRLMRVRFFGYPETYLDNYIENIARVSEEDIRRAAREYIDPRSLRTLVVGPAGISKDIWNSLDNILPR